MTTTIIEKYLDSIDQATFQKMMNHLLHLEGYKFISSPGSVIGKNKTSKGRPDTFFEDGDNFIFCEMTTKERLGKSKSFFNKLKKDLEDCFDEKEIEIPKSKISKVLLAFTGDLTPKELDDLKTILEGHNPNTELIIYSIQQIPFRLIYYPGLADKYIAGVKPTKGTIYTLPDFLKITEKGLQPALTNTFSGREDETNKAKTLLDASDVLILSGGQGVGKSKLAVHLAELFEDELNFEPRVIVGSPVPLWDDLSNFIYPNNKYLIFFDDANKSLPNLDYLLQFIQNREAGTTKVIITIRDYVKHDLAKYLQNHSYRELNIKPLKDKQVTQIVNEYLPKNTSLDALVLDRIIDLSKGNSRIALMATSAIVENQDDSILKDINSLYDRYFQNVKHEVSFLENTQNLKALGLVSFFGAIDRNDKILKETLENHFDINWTELWETYLKLEKVELVDVFSKEIVKISDQVLGTYVFYKTFIDEISALINYSKWIEIFIKDYHKKLNKSLIDVINTFGFHEKKDRIVSLIILTQKNLVNDNERLYKFYEIFWFYREFDTLIFIKDWINNLEQEEIEIDKAKFTYNTNDYTWASEYLKLLINFWEHSTSFTQQALELGLSLIFKQPSRIPEVLKHLNDHIAYQRYDYRYDYVRQHSFIDVLENPNFTEKEKLISNQVFLSKASSLLKWEHSQSQGKGGGEIAIYNFHLFKTPQLIELRRKILIKLFSLFQDNSIAVLDILNSYIWTIRFFDAPLYEEQQIVTDFIIKNLNFDNYAHCKFVHDYIQALEEKNVKVIHDYSSFLNSDLLKIAKLFNPEFDEDRVPFDERESRKRTDIRTFIKDKDLPFIENVFSQLKLIQKNTNNRSDHWIHHSISYLFQELADLDIPLFYSSLEIVMLNKYDLRITFGNIISYPISKKLVPLKDFYNHLNRYDYKEKQHWKSVFFEAIEENDIDEFFLKEFVGFLLSIKKPLYIFRLERYIKYNKQFLACKDELPTIAFEHDNIISCIAEILYSKIDSVNITFDEHICEKCSSYFDKKIDLLKSIYLYNKSNSNRHYDYSGKEIAAISKLDNFFLVEYLEAISKDINYLQNKYLEDLKLRFLWDLPNYKQILDKSIEIIVSKAPLFSNSEHQANILFKPVKSDKVYSNKVYQYISGFISKNYKSKQHILIIMNVVTHSFGNQLLRFLKEFLILNRDVEFIKSMMFSKGGGVLVNSSRVPTYDTHVRLMNEIIDMVKKVPNSLDYIEHIKYWEEDIEWSKKSKIEEMKRDFRGWDN